jgi:hypothetical protein
VTAYWRKTTGRVPTEEAHPPLKLGKAAAEVREHERLRIELPRKCAGHRGRAVLRYVRLVAHVRREGCLVREHICAIPGLCSSQPKPHTVSAAGQKQDFWARCAVLRAMYASSRMSALKVAACESMSAYVPSLCNSHDTAPPQQPAKVRTFLKCATACPSHIRLL